MEGTEAMQCAPLERVATRHHEVILVLHAGSPCEAVWLLVVYKSRVRGSGVKASARVGTQHQRMRAMHASAFFGGILSICSM
jgi:hypothetical protein